MDYNEWLLKAKNNNTYIKKDSIVIDINKSSEEIYNHNSGKDYQEEAGVYNGKEYRSAISRKIGDVRPPHAFLHCSDGVFLAISETETGNLLRKGTCNLNIKML